MAIVMQDIAQLDELYGKNTRITTVSGSQIKLFIQINDLETSEFVSEMLGETTQVYKTPIQRPGQGIFAPRVWAPHYTPRPLRSSLELREMSARLSILMVKNSRSFELTKIRHYADNPYRTFYEKAKAAPPVLPTLRDWQDESLGGAINPAPDLRGEPANASPLATVHAGRSLLQRRAPTRRPTKKPIGKKAPAGDAPLVEMPLNLSAQVSTLKPMRKALSLGDAPAPPAGESCDVRDILASANTGQDESFAAMIGLLDPAKASDGNLRKAAETLASLHQSFGDDKKSN
ncbi:TraM recognition domain-containing protein [Bradyrhizobium elkanii]|uniref:TraM recognition domain-containing protein n=1 Tax=Bradyrhizobium elkanii TaxID=29448 RepID=UPI0006970049|nr:TraM recognition domain-containing protein [Bradyrhizobium elkanii]